MANSILAALAAGGFIAIAFRHVIGTPILVTIVILAASGSFLLAILQRDAELRATNCELKSRGRCGDNIRSTRRVCCSDVRWLEYQEDTTGPETSHHPGGLYAVLRFRSVCILPYVDEQQAAIVIQRIIEKFPELKQQWEGQSPFGRHFTSLGLKQAGGLSLPPTDKH